MRAGFCEKPSSPARVLNCGGFTAAGCCQVPRLLAGIQIPDTITVLGQRLDLKALQSFAQPVNQQLQAAQKVVSRWVPLVAAGVQALALPGPCRVLNGTILSLSAHALPAMHLRGALLDLQNNVITCWPCAIGQYITSTATVETKLYGGVLHVIRPAYQCEVHCGHWLHQVTTLTVLLLVLPLQAGHP